jgi:hypothetical protein
MFARSAFENHAVLRVLLNKEKYGVPVGDVLGLPFVMFAVPPSLAWRGRKLRGGGDVMDNAPALDIHPLLTSDFDKSKVGSVLVARVDGKKLHRAHVHALSKYCSIFLGDLSNTKIFEDGTGSNKTTEELRDLRKFQNEHILQFARKRQFAEFSMLWLTKSQADRDSLEAEQLWTTEELQSMEADQGAHPSCLEFNANRVKWYT